MSYRNRFGRERRYTSGFEGVKAYIKRKHEETESDFARDRYEQYMRQVACPSCGGARLNPTILGVKVGGQSIADITDLSLADALAFVRGLQLSPAKPRLASRSSRNWMRACSSCWMLGLDYLTLVTATGRYALRR